MAGPLRTDPTHNEYKNIFNIKYYGTVEESQSIKDLCCVLVVHSSGKHRFQVGESVEED